MYGINIKILFFLTIIGSLLVCGVNAEEANVTTEESAVVEQVMIYEGNVTIPAENQTVMAVSNITFEIAPNTPLGILHLLAADAKLNYTVNDEAMEETGILNLEGINEYVGTEEKSWFVAVDDIILQNATLDAAEAVNLLPLEEAKTVKFYFGDIAAPVEEAEAVVIVNIVTGESVEGAVVTEEVAAVEENLTVSTNETVALEETVTPEVTPTA